ncbi:unnamed protein product [Callosobruchus maculatus]|uniref:Uncharacterized protein n=1 Tax=Callosobruchus maculatus TaxID=64391 RepID=A0A653C892_CALMS|nr:unnamed protein product [Callosobruchus maculatus]
MALLMRRLFVDAQNGRRTFSGPSLSDRVRLPQHHPFRPPFPGNGPTATASPPESDVKLADGCAPAVPEPSQHQQQSAAPPPQPPTTFTDSSSAAGTGGGKEAAAAAAGTTVAAQHTKLDDCDVDFK